MGGRFGKYGDLKRKAKLRYNKTEKYRIEKMKQKFSKRRKKVKASKQK